MNTSKKLTALLLTIILAVASVPAIFAGEIDCDGSYYHYDENYLGYDDYKAVIEKLQKYAKKGNSDKVNQIYVEEYIPLLQRYMALDSYDHVMEEDCFVIAECEFDTATGTVKKVLNDAPALAIPAFINGVMVKYIAEGAVTGKTELYNLAIPPTVGVIDSIIVRDCPRFTYIMSDCAEFKVLFFENCPSYEGENIPFPFDSTINHITNMNPANHTQIYVTLGMGFAIDSGVIKGDQNNNYNWYDKLTRTEATIMILRLMGLESKAIDYANRPCAFTDVPDWAKGYINLALEEGIVKGVSENTFGSSNPCSAKDFLTMLFRLTDLKEGKDYSWSSIIEDYASCLKAIAGKAEEWESNNFSSKEFYNPGLPFSEHADDFKSYYYKGGKFSRRIATEALYFMLHIIAGEDERSFGDILAQKYDMEDILFYNYYVRRSALGLENKKSRLPNDLLHTFEPREKLLTNLRSGYKPEDKSKIDSEVVSMAEAITSSAKTEYDKIKAVSKWVSEHIFYDYDLFNGIATGYHLSKDVLTHRRTVCSGYAQLTQDMLLSLGIECYTLSSIDHAWNVAVTDGEAIFIDNTWDSPLTYSSGEYKINNKKVKNIMEPGITWDAEYFDCENPEEFYFTHSHYPRRAPKIIIYDAEDEFRYLQKKEEQKKQEESASDSDSGISTFKIKID